MGNAYTVHDQSGVYYITNTVHQWIDVFTRSEYVDILLASPRYCQQHKGLRIYEWVVMSNHMHLIVNGAKDNLSDIIRDFKKYTATKIVNAIADNPKESRKAWLVWLLRQESTIQFWQEGYHGEEVRTRSFYNTKAQYIHLNPLRGGIVRKEEEYLYSSCGDRYGTSTGLLTLDDFV